MKKTLCIILSAVLIISACIFSVNAVTVPQIDTSPSIDMPEFVYCEEGFNILYQFDDPSGITRTFCYLCSGQNPDGSYFTLLADYGGSVYCGDAVKYYELDGYTLYLPANISPDITTFWQMAKCLSSHMLMNTECSIPTLSIIS